MKWKPPPPIKIYEALGAVADGRVHVEGDGAKVYSSSGNKFYEVRYSKAERAVMANDNGSYYQGYLGYPAIAYLMCAGELPYDAGVAELLRGVAWKDLNTRFKNDYAKTLAHILADKSEAEQAHIVAEVERIGAAIAKLSLSQLGPRTKPPVGY